jgi:hypothetical protein
VRGRIGRIRKLRVWNTTASSGSHETRAGQCVRHGIGASSYAEYEEIAFNIY